MAKKRIIGSIYFRDETFELLSEVQRTWINNSGNKLLVSVPRNRMINIFLKDYCEIVLEKWREDPTLSYEDIHWAIADGIKKDDEKQ